MESASRCQSERSIGCCNTSWCHAAPPASSQESATTSGRRRDRLWGETGSPALFLAVGLALWALGSNTSMGNELHSTFSRHRLTGTTLAIVMLITTFTDSAVTASVEASDLTAEDAPAACGGTIPDFGWTDAPWAQHASPASSSLRRILHEDTSVSSSQRLCSCVRSPCCCTRSDVSMSMLYPPAAAAASGKKKLLRDGGAFPPTSDDLLYDQLRVGVSHDVSYNDYEDTFHDLWLDLFYDHSVGRHVHLWYGLSSSERTDPVLIMLAAHRLKQCMYGLEDCHVVHMFHNPPPLEVINAPTPSPAFR